MRMRSFQQTAQVMRLGLEASKQAGKERAWSLKNLPAGVQVLLSFQDNRWRLAIRRKNEAPAEEDVEAVAGAFNVPAGCARRSYTTSEKSSLTQHKTIFYVVEMTWREAPQREAPQREAAQRMRPVRFTKPDRSA